MTEKFLLIRWPDGRTGAVLEADLAKHADNFKGAHIVGWESGESFDGPTTAEGVARKAEREVEARREARRERHEAREAARVVEAEVPVEPVSEQGAKE